MADIEDIIEILDRDGALRLNDEGGDYGAWPEPADSEVALPVNFDRMGGDDLDMEDRATGMPELGNRHPIDRESNGIFVSQEIADAVLRGEARLRGRDNAFPPIDVLAWYQPIHYFANNWGIFIRERSLILLAADLAPRFARFKDRKSEYRHVAALLRAAFAYVFLHEHYHHKIESLAIRLHVVERRVVYPDYFERVARMVAATDDAIEEALANADAYLRLTHLPYSNWFKADERKVIREWMRDTFRNSSPGYRKALDFLQESSFDECEGRLVSQVQEASVSVRKNVRDFEIATNLTRSLFNIKQHVWVLVPMGDRPILPTFHGVLPLDTAKLQKYLRQEGWELVRGAAKGSHSKWRKPGGGMIILPDRKEVSMTVLSSTARTLGHNPRELANRAR